MTEFNLTLGQAIDAARLRETLRSDCDVRDFIWDLEKRGLYWLSEAGIMTPFRFDHKFINKMRFCIKPKEPEMVTLYKAKIYWDKNQPVFDEGEQWYRSKEEFFMQFDPGNVRVFEWKTITVPEEWKDWPDS